MDILAAYDDDAVEQLLDAAPIECLPEYLARLRFVFEAELDRPGPPTVAELAQIFEIPVDLLRR